MSFLLCFCFVLTAQLSARALDHAARRPMRNAQQCSKQPARAAGMPHGQTLPSAHDPAQVAHAHRALQRTHRRVQYPVPAQRQVPGSSPTAACAASGRQRGASAPGRKSAQPRSLQQTVPAPQGAGQRGGDEGSADEDSAEAGFVLAEDTGYLKPQPGWQEDSWGSYGRYSRLSLSASPNPTLVNAQDKNRLKPELRKELGRRLRRGEQL